jgi:hypothetical protein
MTGSTVAADPVAVRPPLLAMPRRRGSLIGALLVLLGLWGALGPLIGPWFGYHIDDDPAWLLTWDRLWLTTLPGAAAVIGGLILVFSRDRLTAAIGAWIAIAGGAWFVVGPSVSVLWSSTVSTTGIGRGSTTERMIVQLVSFYGLGVAITGLASFALARVLVRSERDVVLLQNEGAGAAELLRAREERERAHLAPDRSVEEATDAGRNLRQTHLQDAEVGQRTAPPAAVQDSAWQREVPPPSPPSATRADAVPQDVGPGSREAVVEPSVTGPNSASERSSPTSVAADGRPVLPGQRPAPAISGEYPAASERNRT